jgi:hypothetical protein
MHEFDLQLGMDMEMEIGFPVPVDTPDGIEPPAIRKQGELALCDKCSHLVPPRCLKRKTANQYRRAFSETKLLELLDPVLEPENTYHVISGGDVDSLSYIKHILRAGPLDYLLLSTWCMSLDDVLQLAEWINAGRIGRIDAYVGEIFPGSYSKEHAELKNLLEPIGGRVCVFKNHSKIYAGIGPGTAFAVESSANINTNPRTEQTAITVSRAAFDFYKEFFDGVNSFTKDFKNWTPWEVKS